MRVAPLQSSRYPSSINYIHLVDRGRPWWKNSRLILLNALVVVLLLTSSSNGFDASMMNGLQSLTQWEKDFNYPSGGRLGLLLAIQNIGGLCAYPFAPYVSDGFGRKKAIFLGAVLMLFGTILQTAAQSVDMFIGSRFMIGFGLTFAACAAPLLILEISYPTLRGPLTSLYNTLWFLGSVTAAWSTFGTSHILSSWAWRLPSSLQSLPCIIQLLAFWWLPESPRYLVSKGRRAEALQILAYYHSDGDEEHPLVEYEFEEIKAALLLERVASMNIGWKSLFMTQGNRRRLRVIIAIAFFSQWSGNGLLSYYLSKVLNSVKITGPRDQLLISGCLNILNLVCAVIAALLCDKIGRRKLFLASTITMLIFWTLLTIMLSLYTKDNSQIAAYLFVVLLFFYTSGYAIAYTPLIVSYTLEILPFALRARGFTIFNFAVTLSVVFNQYINPLLLEKLKWKYYLVYVCWLVFELIFVYLYIIETKGKTLEETAALFDGNQTVADISLRAAVFAGIDSQTQSGNQRNGTQPSEIYRLDSSRSNDTTPSPLSEKRMNMTKKLPVMPYSLDVAKPEEVHVRML